MAATTTLLQRPTSYAGVWSWITTVDHKRIGILYGVTAFLFFLLAGLAAALMRLQLAQSGTRVLSEEVYNQFVTMHGTMMVFLVIMPLSAAFFNYLVPLQIGARDVAFPRLNALSYWVFLAGGLFLTSSFLLGGAPNAGWFAYANLTTKPFNPGHGMDFWVLGLQLLGISSIAASLNFFVTIVNMRAPGMSLFRMPLFVWMTLVTMILLLTAMPVITIGVTELLFDRYLGTNFFNTAKGADPLLWQHLFWVFGHPEVYILILPAMGIVSEVLPTFSKKPLFGYPLVVLSGIFIGFMSWGVWSHHMFTVGLGPVAETVFSITTMLIAVPTGVKIFNWLATLWGGSLDFKTAMLFALGFIALFIVGGLSGVTHAATPADLQQQDTYYIVAHFHYVLFGGSLMGLFAGMYYWWPKMTGRLLNERIGQLHFWLVFVGMNLTFGPMHILGLNGMPRRIATYSADKGWDFWNLVATIGAFIIGIGVLVFLYNVFYSRARGERATSDPWDGRTLEWTIPSPPPIYNFAQIPAVHSRDDFWHKKYVETLGGRPQRVPAGAAEPQGHPRDTLDLPPGVHLPSLSYFPVLVGLGLFLAALGLVTHWGFNIVGILVLLLGVFGLALEPAAEPSSHHE